VPRRWRACRRCNRFSTAPNIRFHRCALECGSRAETAADEHVRKTLGMVVLRPRLSFPCGPLGNTRCPQFVQRAGLVDQRQRLHRCMPLSFQSPWPNQNAHNRTSSNWHGSDTRAVVWEQSHAAHTGKIVICRFGDLRLEIACRSFSPCGHATRSTPRMVTLSPNEHIEAMPSPNLAV